MMVKVGRFVDGVKAAGVAFFAAVPVMFPCGCHCADMGICPIPSFATSPIFWGDFRLDSA